MSKVRERRSSNRIRFKTKIPVTFDDYILTLYRPWQVETADKSTLPGSTLWNDLCQYMHTLEHGRNKEGPSFLDRIRSKWFTNAAHELRIFGEDRTAASKHRCQCAK